MAENTESRAVSGKHGRTGERRQAPPSGVDGPARTCGLASGDVESDAAFDARRPPGDLRFARRAGPFAAYPFGVQVATIRGCLKAEDKASTSAAFAASQAPALLYSTAVTATDPPENTKSVKMKVMWPFPSADYR